jgi:hypothetical protein
VNDNVEFFLIKKDNELIECLTYLFLLPKKVREFIGFDDYAYKINRVYSFLSLDDETHDLLKEHYLCKQINFITSEIVTRVSTLYYTNVKVSYALEKLAMEMTMNNLILVKKESD